MNITTKGILYDLINPSDAVSFMAPTFEAALGATLLVGEGAYGAKPIQVNGDPKAVTEDLEVPILLFDSGDWLADRGIELTDLLTTHHDDIMATLASFMYCHPSEYSMATLALEHITDPDRRREFLAQWDDRQRSSLNQICNRAHELVKRAPKEQT